MDGVHKATVAVDRFGALHTKSPECDPPGRALAYECLDVRLAAPPGDTRALVQSALDCLGVIRTSVRLMRLVMLDSPRLSMRDG